MVMPDGEWIRQMNIKDGYALQHAIKSGLQIAVITGSASSAVGKRLQKLGIHDYFENTQSKSSVLLNLTQKLLKVFPFFLEKRTSSKPCN
jgi:3-deoxy-D-manno-octulosonate 8-phosphate phosphatase (KDO 8-P phosphatase)